MVDPRGLCKQVWDWLVVCFVVVTLVCIPLGLAFYDSACDAGSGAPPLAATALLLTQACRGTLPLGTNATFAAGALVADEFGLAPACEPYTLFVLDLAMDAFFWLDMAVIFRTGTVAERDLRVEYRPAVVALTCAGRGRGRAIDARQAPASTPPRTPLPQVPALHVPDRPCRRAADGPDRGRERVVAGGGRGDAHRRP